MTPFARPGSLTLGYVSLRVADLRRSTDFYVQALGLKALISSRRRLSEARSGPAPDHVTLGSDGKLIELVEAAQAQPNPDQAGLYHYAINYPSGLELALALRRLGESGVAVSGASDHGTHLAIYLDDPDGNGIELAVDRPRRNWPEDLGYHRGPAPLDLDELMELALEHALPREASGLWLGHLHLHVADIARSVRFYRDSLGLELRGYLGSAAFFAAGGYHHHVAVNTWRGEVGPVPQEALGLRYATLRLPNQQWVSQTAQRVASDGHEVDQASPGEAWLLDPDGNRLLLIS